MDKKFYIYFMAICFCLNSTVFSEEVDKKLHSQCIYPSVVIKNDLNRNYGSGVILRSEKRSENEYWNVAITCNHVATGNYPKQFLVGVPKYKEWSTFEEYDFYKAALYAGSKDHDLAILLFISEKKMPTAEVDFDTKLFIGNSILRIGNGTGDEPRLDFGKVTSISAKLPRCPWKGKVYRSSVYTVPGDSGGPVFHNGKIIGIMQAIATCPRNSFHYDYCHEISFIIPSGRLKEWNNETNNAVAFSYDSKKKLPAVEAVALKLLLYGMSKNPIQSSLIEKWEMEIYEDF